MNSTSFTSIDPSPCVGVDNANDKNIDDTSSTAHLTLNSASGVGDGSTCRLTTHDSQASGDSSSSPEVSPSVHVLSSSTRGNGHHHHHLHNLHDHDHNNHHHHHNHHNGNNNSYRHHSLSSSSSLPRASQLLAGGFSFTNRLHLSTKHQRTLWSRATHLEKILILALLLLCIICVVLFISLTSIIMRTSKLPTNNDEQQTTSLSNNEQPWRATPTNSYQPFDNNGTSRPTTLFPPKSEKVCVNNRTQSYCLTPDCVKVAASVIEAIDTSVDPCDDFYLYSCGDWIKSNPLPDGKSNWGTFSKLWQDNQSIMRSVLEDNVSFKPGSAEEKAKIYYESCLDRNDTVELRGTEPMQDLIQSAGGWNMSGIFNVKKWNLQESLQIYHNQYNRGGLFSWAVGADERNSTRNIIQLDQGGLGLPSRDYYLNKTDKNVVLEAYLIYMIKVAELMGGQGDHVEEQMKDILEFEKKLATITVPQDQRRDDERMYHKFTLRELTDKAPFLNWTKYFDDAFDYHSRTTIDFSSSIVPKLSQKQQQQQQSGTSQTTTTGDNSTNQQIKNDQTKYSLTNNNSTITNDQQQQQLVNNNEQKQQQQQTTIRHPSAIGKHHVTDDEQIVIYSPEYFEELSTLIQQYLETDRGKATLANYMAWSVIQSLIATLPKNFRDASKVLRKALIGSEGIEVSWRYCVTDTNQVMGFALGSLFVRRVFHGQSKERAEEMIYSIRNAFKDNLVNLSWMDDKTRSLAREKADFINQMIGFPDFILSSEKLNDKYQGLDLNESNYFENNIKVNVLSLRENMEKINKPANKTEWEMTPPMVNAYYTPTKNQIVFPAGILQTPFYDLSYPNSLNYGAMGVVMGHELTHAFDDQGREYDKDGNLYQWWANETLKNFEERVKCFVDQYSTYRIDDNNLNGKQTLGENIADNGGLKAAFRAYEKWSNANPEPQLPGLQLTSKQLFFVGFAQVWCSISTPEAVKLQVLNDPHAPAQFRVIGTLSNSHEFAREFNCKPGTNMNPDKKCVVW